MPRSGTQDVGLSLTLADGYRMYRKIHIQLTELVRLEVVVITDREHRCSSSA